MKNVVDVLEERGLVDNVTSPELHKILEKPVTVYAGFDPSSDSLQAGNFVTIMTLCHFQRCGHKVIALVGGATGLIGDPSGKAAERELLGEETVDRNVRGIRENLSRFLDFNHPTAPAVLVNNNDWMKQFTFVRFLRDVGKHFRMGVMLGKESVKARMEGESGMSFAEFSYQLLQAYDFLHLYDTAGCAVQVGGSDQWGNITAGIDLVRKLRGAEVYGLTTPLVCDASGQKFGKSEGNAVYLDAKKTPYYDFYQFFVRTADADAIRFLKIFTFLSREEIAGLERQLKEHPESRAAQVRLAEEVTRQVHGEQGLKEARQASSTLFGDSMEGMKADDLLKVFAQVPSAELPRNRVEGALAVDLCAAAGFCKSKSEARRLVEKGGLYINSRRVGAPDYRILPSDIVEGRLVVLRSGKKTFYLVKVG